MSASELKPKKKKSSSSKTDHYVSSKEFVEEIKLYYKTNVISNNLAESLTKIANGLSYAPNFINYTYKDEMVGDAVVKMFSALKNKKFKIDTGFSPFSYFTTIAFHAFINRIKKEKKYQDSVSEYKEKLYTDLMIDETKIYIKPSADAHHLDEDQHQ